MKNLIRKISYAICIVLLTCTFCLAHVEIDNTYVPKPISISSDSAKVKVGGVELLTIKLMIDYEEECWNDSTEIDVYIDPNRKTEIATGVYSTTLMMGYYEKQWIHKIPTFQEFVRWAAKKYGL